MGFQALNGGVVALLRRKMHLAQRRIKRHATIGGIRQRGQRTQNFVNRTHNTPRRQAFSLAINRDKPPGFNKLRQARVALQLFHAAAVKPRFPFPAVRIIRVLQHQALRVAKGRMIAVPVRFAGHQHAVACPHAKNLGVKKDQFCTVAEMNDGALFAGFNLLDFHDIGIKRQWFFGRNIISGELEIQASKGAGPLREQLAASVEFKGFFNRAAFFLADDIDQLAIITPPQHVIPPLARSAPSRWGKRSHPRRERPALLRRLRLQAGSAP